MKNFDKVKLLANLIIKTIIRAIKYLNLNTRTIVNSLRQIFIKALIF